MKFITAERFLKSDKRVQQAILEWWKPSVGDLVFDKDNIIDVVVPNLCVGDYKEDLDKNKVIPLLTEGQLREFIENKTDGKIDTEYDCETGYDIQIYNSYNKYRPKFNFVDYGKSLLQALWQVACEIIKEE